MEVDAGIGKAKGSDTINQASLLNREQPHQKTPVGLFYISDINYDLLWQPAPREPD
jgi:hypothetical protein